MPDEKLEIYDGNIANIDETQDVATVADKYLKEIIFTKQSIGLRFLYLGQLLYNVKEKEYYKPYADSYSEYVAMPEINMKLSTADKLKRVYRQYIVEWGIEPSELGKVGHSKLIALLEQTDIDENNVEEWLAKAETLSHRDIMIEAGGEITSFDGVINANFYVDDMGLLVEISNAPKNIPKGLYRMTKDGAVGAVKKIAYAKGRKTNEDG